MVKQRYCVKFVPCTHSLLTGTSQRPYEWTPTQVCTWINRVRLNNKYDSLITAHAIDGEVLIDSMRSKFDWLEAGVKDLDDASRLAVAVNALNPDS